MIKVCGDNCNLILSEESNNKSVFKSPVVSPPLDSEISPSSLLSYSIFYNHSVFITKDGLMYGIGDNRDYRISGSLPNEKLFQFTEFEIKNEQNHKLVPISCVCGCKYTLYLVSNPEDKSKRYLAYSSNNLKSISPVILNIGNRKPICLYGGRNDCAAIDSDGGIIFIQGSNSELSNLSAHFLSGGEKPVCVACCEKYVFALSKSGRLFQSFSTADLEFSDVVELNGIEITGLSGSWFHCLAVTKDGRVFGCGENYCGQIGLGKSIEETDKFKEIETLRDCEITAVYAGGTHSLFQKSNGKVLACGCNFYGQLLLETGPSHNKIYSPVETTVNSNASFCVAGDSISIIFLNDVPQNCPNMIIKHS